MRAELWRRTLPASAPAPPNIDFDALAERYELSGGFIKVACERAAYVAGANSVEIDERPAARDHRAHVPRARQALGGRPARIGTLYKTSNDLTLNPPQACEIIRSDGDALQNLQSGAPSPRCLVGASAGLEVL